MTKPAFGVLVAPLRYVIHSPDLDDYLAFIEVRRDITLARWHHTPEGAITFDTFAEAEKIAYVLYNNQRAPGNRQYRIQICELYESQKQYRTRPAAEIAPRGSVPVTDEVQN